MRRRASVLFAVLAGLFAVAAPPAAAEPDGRPVGTVSRLVDPAFTQIPDGREVRLALGATIHQGRQVRTGPGARLEITFIDGSRIALGADAHATVDTLLFDPAAGRGTTALDVAAGAFRYISGRLGTIAGAQASVTTAFATIGIRGTDFWGGMIDGAGGVAVFEGIIAVTAGGETALLDRPGLGATITEPGAPPTDIQIWQPEKLARAAATVAFPN